MATNKQQWGVKVAVSSENTPEELAAQLAGTVIWKNKTGDYYWAAMSIDPSKIDRSVVLDPMEIDLIDPSGVNLDGQQVADKNWTTGTVSQQSEKLKSRDWQLTGKRDGIDFGKLAFWGVAAAGALYVGKKLLK